MSALDVALLRLLHSTRVHQSAGDLAGQLGAALSQVEGRIRELMAAGFQIEDRPGLGYRLLGSADRLVADDVLARMASGGALVREVVVFEETDSTNDYAARLGRDAVAGGVMVFAERQTSGRGRFGRRWDSASHLGIWGSLLLRPTLAVAHWPRLTTGTAVAIARVLQEASGLSTQIKWPNDVQIGGRKVAGILMETGIDRFQQPFAVLGFGINVNHAAGDFPDEIAALATSVLCASGRTACRAALAAALLEELERVLPSLDAGFAGVVAEASRRSSLLGRWVRLWTPGGALEGFAEDLDEEGRLRLRLGDGRIETLLGGEVSLSGAH